MRGSRSRSMKVGFGRSIVTLGALLMSAFEPRSCSEMTLEQTSRSATASAPLVSSGKFGTESYSAEPSRNCLRRISSASIRQTKISTSRP